MWQRKQRRLIIIYLEGNKGISSMATKKKKVSKKEEYEQCCRDIFSNNVLDIENNYAKFREFKTTQKILKKPPKDTFLWWASKGLFDYYIANHDTKYLPQWLYDFDVFVGLWVDKWNDGFNIRHYRPWISDSKLYAVPGAYKLLLTKTFNERHPDMAEADALFAAYVEMYCRAKVTNKEIEDRLRKLTNNFDAEIIANLPYMVTNILNDDGRWRVYRREKH